MDSQRELLDTLMGINRNNDRKDEHISDFRDDRVCKFFLTGMCPYGTFVQYLFAPLTTSVQTFL